MTRLAALTLLAALVGVSTRASAQDLGVAVVPVSGEGVADVVVARAQETVAESVVALGYRLVPAVDVVAAITSLSAPARPRAADLFRIMVLARGERAVHVHVYVAGDAYAATVHVASLDGTGPFVRQASGGPDTFLVALAAAVRDAMPALAEFDAAAAERYRRQPNPDLAVQPTAAFGASFANGRAVRAPNPRTRGPRFGATFAMHSSWGSNDNVRFYNQLLGVRFDVHVGTNVVLGAYGGYINLDLGEARGSNVVGYLQLEDRLRFVATRNVQFPLRLAFGYMPRNGPVLRFAAGIRFPIRDAFELGIDLLAPTFYWVPGDRVVTYDLGAEVTYRFGSRD